VAKERKVRPARRVLSGRAGQRMQEGVFAMARLVGLLHVLLDSRGASCTRPTVDDATAADAGPSEEWARQLQKMGRLVCMGAAVGHWGMAWRGAASAGFVVARAVERGVGGDWGKNKGRE
jgi:hypothetical protein